MVTNWVSPRHSQISAVKADGSCSRAYSIHHSGWQMPANHGDGAILHNKIGTVLSIRPAISQTRIMTTPHASRSRYMLLHYGSNLNKMNISRLWDIVRWVLSFSVLIYFISTVSFIYASQCILWPFNWILSVPFPINLECSSLLQPLMGPTRAQNNRNQDQWATGPYTPSHLFSVSRWICPRIIYLII